MKEKQNKKTRRKFIRELSLMAAGINLMQFSCDKNEKEERKVNVIVDPYKNVEWSTFQQYKAALHFHTLQSDGYHTVNEVVNTYHDKGFTILAITDHDWNYPNARIKWGHLPEEKASPYPKGPNPENYPANPTWPWTDYGTPSPEELGIVGIQGNELTFRHHINSYFSDYGVWYERTGTQAPYGGIVNKDGIAVWEDDQLYGIRDKGGLAIINHPGVYDSENWWERKSLDWYIERCNNHSSDYLIGIEVGNMSNAVMKYNEGLWDQLLARFMPGRPIWGNGTDDMHNLNSVRETYTVFLLDELTDKAVRKAMVDGQFYFCRSTRVLDFQKGDDYGNFPIINRIKINEDKGTITIDATGYDEIMWISAPENFEPLANYKTSNQPWDLGKVVGKGEALDLSTPGIKNFVRAELIRTDGEDTFRAFTNPFGVEVSN